MIDPERVHYCGKSAKTAETTKKEFKLAETIIVYSTDRVFRLVFFRYIIPSTKP